MSKERPGEVNLDNIQIETHDLSQLQREKPVVIKYRSNRGNNEQKTRTGTIMQTQPLGEQTARIWIYDSNNNRKLELTIGDTLNESTVRSQKTETMSTIGSLTLLLVGERSTQSPSDVKQQHIINKRNNEYKSVVAAAHISTNKPALNWLQTQK